MDSSRMTTNTQNLPQLNIRSIGVIFGIVTVLSGWIWQVSKYPDRDEFNSLETSVHNSNKDFNRNLSKLKEAQSDLKSDISAIKASQSRMESNQEAILRVLLNSKTSHFRQGK